jgi:hypothetical protein
MHTRVQGKEVPQDINMGVPYEQFWQCVARGCAHVCCICVCM